MKTSAKVIADSISPTGVRLTTLEVTMHRFVLAEFNTHRVFSRNSASSRAIPFAKQVEKVRRHPAIPVVWAGEQKGMQGGDEVDQPDVAETIWLNARHSAVVYADALAAVGVHKSVVNRLLEPFMWHTVIVSATEWDGFWRQRCSPLAQPEIRVAAECMLEVFEASTPVELDHGMWHLPYLDGDTIAEVTDSEAESTKVLKQVSAARCARVSYLTQDGDRNYIEDLKLYERLVSADPAHASPLEHVATPDEACDVGNFRGWRQMRHEELGF